MTDKERQQLLQQLLEKQKTDKLKPSDRYDIPQQDMPEQDPAIRRGNVNEVATGYTETHARLEAMRCLQCKKAPCVNGCPVQIRIRDFVTAIAEGNYMDLITTVMWRVGATASFFTVPKSYGCAQ